MLRALKWTVPKSDELFEWGEFHGVYGELQAKLEKNSFTGSTMLKTSSISLKDSNTDNTWHFWRNGWRIQKDRMSLWTSGKPARARMVLSYGNAWIWIWRELFSYIFKAHHCLDMRWNETCKGLCTVFSSGSFPWVVSTCLSAVKAALRTWEEISLVMNVTDSNKGYGRTPGCKWKRSAISSQEELVCGRELMEESGSSKADDT